MRPAAWLAAMPKAWASCAASRSSSLPAVAAAAKGPTMAVGWKPRA